MDVPPTTAFDPTQMGNLGDPYAALAEVRRGGPVAQAKNGMWVVTGYEAALEVLRHKGFASGPLSAMVVNALPPGAARDEMSHRINFLDPPDHTRVRGLVLKAFTPRRVAELAPWITAMAEQLLDGIDIGGPFDLLKSFAHQLPSLVISELLGVPPEDRDRLTKWSDAVAPLLGLAVQEEERQHALAAAEDFHAYLAGLIEERKRHPREDLLSALIAVEQDGERLNRTELMSLAATLYSAGHRTTRDLFSNGLSVLLGGEGLYARVASGEWDVKSVVAEFLRYETPTLFVARIPVEPVTIAGVEVGAWQPVLVFLAAANRDPAVYEKPDAFAPGRGGPASLSFAHGAHFCLGAALATTEAEIMLQSVSQRWPGLRLAQGAQLRWRQRGPFRGLDALPVTAGQGG